MHHNIVSYGEAIRLGFEYVLSSEPNSIVMGQGLWSPWYVGNSMTDLDKKFGKDRVIDTPVSELATTGAAIGAGLTGLSVIMVHPRMDFAILAADQIVNQAAKWRHMLGNQGSPNVTFRTIINRGGEQGAQHSQALHSWYAHIPGLRVLMPATPRDARDMLIASAQSDDPVVYIDDRWCYDLKEELPPPGDVDIKTIAPRITKEGEDITLVGAGFSAMQCTEIATYLNSNLGISAEVIDLRQINPLSTETITSSVKKTGRLCVVDGGWSTCGLAGEIIASVVEDLPLRSMKSKPLRFTLPDAPAPSAPNLEAEYYLSSKHIAQKIKLNLGK